MKPSRRARSARPLIAPSTVACAWRFIAGVSWHLEGAGTASCLASCGRPRFPSCGTDRITLSPVRSLSTVTIIPLLRARGRTGGTNLTRRQSAKDMYGHTPTRDARRSMYARAPA